MDLPLRADLFQAGRRYIRLAPSTRISTSIVDVVGSDVNLVVGCGSVMGEAITLALASCFAGMFVETATGDQLDRMASDRYGIARMPATGATVALTFTRPNTLAGAGTIPGGTTIQTANGLQFAVDADTPVPAAALVVTANATCQTSGPDTNAPENSLTQVVGTLFDTSFQVTNLAQAAGGADQEDDATFKGRIRGYFTTIRRGTLSAINFAALEVAGVAVATALEITNPSNQFPAAIVKLIVGDAAGNSSPSMLTAVRNELLQFRAQGIPVIVSGGVVDYEPVTWKLSYATGIDSVQAQNDVQAVTVALTQFLSPGETLHRSSLIAAARQVPGVIVSVDSLVVPAGDLVPTTAGQYDPAKLIRVRATDVAFA